MNLRALRSSFATRPDEDLAIFDAPEKFIPKLKKIKTFTLKVKLVKCLKTILKSKKKLEIWQK